MAVFLRDLDCATKECELVCGIFVIAGYDGVDLFEVVDVEFVHNRVNHLKRAFAVFVFDISFVFIYMLKDRLKLKYFFQCIEINKFLNQN